MRTKAAVLYEINKPLVIEEIEIPKLEKGQVLVKILATGFCRAQLNEVRGLKGVDHFLPHLLGHEASAIVEDTGEGITKVKKGDYVVCSWIKGSGMEGAPARYHKGKTVIHAGKVTTFSTYAVVSENRLTKIPTAVPPDVASILGCAIATGVGIVYRTLDVKKGSTIAVFGVGGIGSSVILGAKMKRCSKIIALDIRKEKLQFAKSLGATHTIDSHKEDIHAKIQNIARGGVDYAVEASGNKSAMEKAFEEIKDTGKLVIAGNLRKGEKICILPFDLIKGKKILGTWGGETQPDEDIPYYAKKYLSGDLDIEKLITRKFQLDRINSVLEIMQKNDSLGRMIIEISPPVE